MVESKAEVNTMYRGFIINLRVSKESNGERSVFTSIYYHVPELKPEYAEQIDKREVIKTQDGEIECMRTHDTIGPHEAAELTEDWFYNPKYDEDDESLLSRFYIFNSSGDNSPPSLSKMIRDVIESVQSNIDDYIEAHSIVEISENEVKHGLEQSLATPVNNIEINTPNLNTNTSYDSVRPNISEIENKLESTISES